MKKMIKTLLAVSMLATMSGCGSDKSTANADAKKIGVLQFTEHPALDASYKGFVEGLKQEGFEDDKNIVIDFQNAQGDPSNCQTIADKLVNDKNDLIYAIATPSAQQAANATKDIPIVLCAVTDPASSGLVKSNDKPGANVTGASDLSPISDQIELLKKISPDAKKVAVMYCGSEDNSIFQAKIAKEEIEKVGLEYIEATVADSSTIQQVAESIVGKVDAIYIPTDNLLAEYMTTVAMVTNQAKIPVYVGEGNMAANGGIATYGIDYFNLGVLAGKQAAKILKGESKPADMPIEYLDKKDCEFVINTKTAKEINITIPKDLLDSAKKVGE